MEPSSSFGFKRTRDGGGGDLGDDDRFDMQRTGCIMINGMEVDQLANDDITEYEQFWDERIGEELDMKAVRNARSEEVNFMKNDIQLYEEQDESECWRLTGKAPITTKWVDVNKGTKEAPDIRCRLVARDFKPRGEQHREDLFAAMPPLESKKLLFRMAAAEKKVWHNDKYQRMKLMLIDVKKAHLNGIVGEDDHVFVKLPVEAGVGDKVGKLKRWLYGMRPAAQAWENDYVEHFKEVGLARGKAAPTVFYDPVSQLRCVVHGDDFTFLGYEDELMKIKEHMQGWYQLKVRAVLGDDLYDDKETTILNRELRWCEDGSIEFEADRKHVKILKEEMNMNEMTKSKNTPIEKETKEDLANEELDIELDKKEATKFRAVAARAN